MDWLLQAILFLSISGYRSLWIAGPVHSGFGVFNLLEGIAKEELARGEIHHGHRTDDRSLYNTNSLHFMLAHLLCHVGLVSKAAIQT